MDTTSQKIIYPSVISQKEPEKKPIKKHAQDNNLYEINNIQE